VKDISVRKFSAHDRSDNSCARALYVVDLCGNFNLLLEINVQESLNSGSRSNIISIQFVLEEPRDAF